MKLNLTFAISFYTITFMQILFACVKQIAGKLKFFNCGQCKCQEPRKCLIVICRIVAIINYVAHVCKGCKIAQLVAVILLVGSVDSQLYFQTS